MVWVPQASCREAPTSQGEAPQSLPAGLQSHWAVTSHPTQMSGLPHFWQCSLSGERGSTAKQGCVLSIERVPPFEGVALWHSGHNVILALRQGWRNFDPTLFGDITMTSDLDPIWWALAWDISSKATLRKCWILNSAHTMELSYLPDPAAFHRTC